MFELLLVFAGYLVWQDHTKEQETSTGGRSSPAEDPVADVPPEDELSPEELAVQEFSKRANLIFLGTTAGVVVSPIFTAVTLPFLALQTFALCGPAEREVKERGKVGGAVIRAVAANSMLLGGAVWISAVSGAIFAATERLQLRIQRSSRRDLSSVFGELPRVVRVRDGAAEVDRPFDQLAVGDVVIVRAGEAIPVDGIVAAGAASIDQQALTGESQPVECGPGDEVYAATIVLSGGVEIPVQKTGQETLVGSIEDILQQTTSYTSGLELKGKEIADRTIVPTLALSGAALPFLGQEAATCMLAVYPGEGMRVLGPMSLLNFVRRAAENRILVKDARALETLQDVDTVVFDKTGTLTEKQPSVAAVHTAFPWEAADVLRHAAAAEERQTHPIALAILEEAGERGLELPEVDEASYDIGFGISVVVEGKPVRVGSARFIERCGLEPSPALRRCEEASSRAGHSLVYVAIDGRVAGAVELQSTVRQEARDLVRRLQARGLSVYILSGDHEHPTRSLAEDLGVDRHFSGTLPDQKAELIREWQREGKTVCFVGDGINDSIALKTAPVSISLAGASTVAADTAEIVFMDASLEKLIPLFQIADDLAVNMRNNLVCLLAPSPLLVLGIPFLGFGYGTTIALVSASSVAGIANAALAGQDLTRSAKAPRKAVESRRVGHPDKSAEDLSSEERPAC